MTFEQFFVEIDKLNKQKDRLYRIRRRIVMIEEQASTIKASVGDNEIKSNSSVNFTEELIDEKLDLLEEEKLQKKSIKEKEKELTLVANKLDNDIYRDVIYFRYIKKINWLDIADILGFSYDYTRGALRNDTLESFKCTLG